MTPYNDDDLLTLEIQVHRGKTPLSADEVLRLINMCRDLLAEAEDVKRDCYKQYKWGFDDGYAAAERGE